MDEHQNYEIEREEEQTTKLVWKYIEMWVLRPFYRGALFGIGHFLALRVICPFVSRQVGISYK